MRIFTAAIHCKTERKRELLSSAECISSLPFCALEAVLPDEVISKLTLAEIIHTLVSFTHVQNIFQTTSTLDKILC